MSRTVYLDGAYLPEDQARVSIFDRGFLFADGVYEVTAVVDGKLVDVGPHVSRLHRSLREIELIQPISDHDLLEFHHELIKRNDLKEGIVYFQVTRGVAERDFAYPEGVTGTIAAFTQPKQLVNPPMASEGVSVATVPDIRWQRRDIKSIALLPQAMGKQAAKQRGAFEAWMVEDGLVTEGTSSSAFIVTGEGRVVTRPLSKAILPGVTRRALLKLMETTDIELEERAFTVEEARGAQEAFLTSASTFLIPVVEIDGSPVGAGRPGPVTNRLRQLYLDAARDGARFAA